MIEHILNKAFFSKTDILRLLNTTKDEAVLLYQKAAKVKEEHVGNKVYFRGLIEMSNICSKDCFYCGIRKSNKQFERYTLENEAILEAARFAYSENYASLVIQSGELQSAHFTDNISNLLKTIKLESNHELGITISLGEQEKSVYQKWFNAGAHRYLLRIESSNKELYYKLHPKDKEHDFENRISCIRTLKEIGFQTGTGIMIGLPFQKLEHLAEDLLFMKDMDIDMCGMGPYVEHADTPLFQYKDQLLSQRERFVLSLKMIAILRLMMPKINIAAATALQAIDPLGREKALKVGANIMMPNITPGVYRNDYSLYQNKPCVDEEASDCKNCLEARINLTGNTIGYGQWGDSKHFLEKQKTLLDY